MFAQDKLVSGKNIKRLVKWNYVLGLSNSSANFSLLILVIFAARPIVALLTEPANGDEGAVMLSLIRLIQFATSIHCQRVCRVFVLATALMPLRPSFTLSREGGENKKKGEMGDLSQLDMP